MARVNPLGDNKGHVGYQVEIPGVAAHGWILIKKGSLCYSRQAGHGLLSTVTRGLQRMMSHQIPSKEQTDLSGSVSYGDSWTSGQQ